jgi:DNA-binding transcriptional regulator YdaS (Cro superfamily)
MKLAAFLKRFEPDARADFALRVGTTLGHLNNVAYASRTASAALTRSISKQSDGQVREWDLRPDDWHLIWTELVGTDGAPAPRHADACATA